MEILRPVRGNYCITFNYADHENWRNSHPGVAYNPGIDFYSDDRNIYSCDAGVVDKIGIDPSGYGNYIKLKHSWGFSLYAHLMVKPDFPANLEIPAGTIIGEMGFTGNVRPTGPAGTHLHFETRDLNNKCFEPKFEDYVSLPDTEPKQDESNSAQYVRVCAEAVAVRFEPAGRFFYYAAKGDKFQKAFEIQKKNGLNWQKVLIPFWIAENDGHDQLLEDA